MVPLYTARVADLRHGRAISVTCRKCGHVAELAVDCLRQRLAAYSFVKHLGPQFRCRQCGHKGAAVDARWALGYHG